MIRSGLRSLKIKTINHYRFCVISHVIKDAIYIYTFETCLAVDNGAKRIINVSGYNVPTCIISFKSTLIDKTVQWMYYCQLTRKQLHQLSSKRRTDLTPALCLGRPGRRFVLGSHNFMIQLCPNQVR